LHSQSQRVRNPPQPYYGNVSVPRFQLCQKSFRHVRCLRQLLPCNLSPRTLLPHTLSEHSQKLCLRSRPSFSLHFASHRLSNRQYSTSTYACLKTDFGVRTLLPVHKTKRAGANCASPPCFSNCCLS